MNRSDTIAKLAAALAKAQPEFLSAVKGAENTFLKSKYADLTSVWDAVKDTLPKHGLAISQLFEPMPGEESVCVETVLLHESGEYISGKIIIPFTKDSKNAAQAAGSAATYARRYGLAAILGIVTDDDDGHGAGVDKETTRRTQNTRPAATRAPSNPPPPAPEKTTPAVAKAKGPEWKGAIKKRETEIREILRTLYKLGDEPFDGKTWNPETLEDFVQDRFDHPIVKLDADEVEILVTELQGRIDEANERVAIQSESSDKANPEPMITEAQVKSINRLCDIKDREPSEIAKDITTGATSDINKLTEAEAEAAIKLLNKIKK